jgi:formamidopyrimidine-DNA glycosylase
MISRTSNSLSLCSEALGYAFLMPELPEVEVLVRQLRPLLRGRTIRGVEVRRARVLRPTSTRQFKERLRGAKFVGLTRRGKYLRFDLSAPGQREPLVMLGHLGMTGRMYVASGETPLPKHAAVVLSFGAERFVFEDTRYFGRLTFDTQSFERLGPEPLEDSFTVDGFQKALSKSSQAIKVKLLDQSLVAGVGNIYASEALYRARIAPGTPSRRLKPQQVKDLWRAIRAVLRDAIARGSTLPLEFSCNGAQDGLFYFGSAEGADYYEERLRVYDRRGKPCYRCGTEIQQDVHGGRSTYYCPHCQRR